jgi:hypothetical protein
LKVTGAVVPIQIIRRPGCRAMVYADKRILLATREASQSTRFGNVGGLAVHRGNSLMMAASMIHFAVGSALAQWSGPGPVRRSEATRRSGIGNKGGPTCFGPKSRVVWTFSVGRGYEMGVLLPL